MGGSSPQGMGAAVALAKNASIGAVVLVVGLDGSQEGEGQDRHSLALPGLQLPLIAQVSAAAKARLSPVPVIVVVMSGGPVDLAPVRDNADVDAVLWVGYPGQQGGQAVARALFNDDGAAPSGRLTTTWHSAAFVNESNFTSMAMRAGPVAPDGTLTPGLPGRGYRFYRGKSLAYAFGSGLSGYTSFTEKWKHGRSWLAGGASASSSDDDDDAGPPAEAEDGGSAGAALRLNARALERAINNELRAVVQLSCIVTNTGNRSGEHVIIVTAAAGTKPFTKSVVGFERVRLDARASTVVDFNVSSTALAFGAEEGASGDRRGQRWVFEFVPVSGVGAMTLGDSDSLVVEAL